MNHVSPVITNPTTYPTLAGLIPAHWHSGSVALPDGAELRYLRTGGGGPALLLLHGVQAAGPMWLRTAQALEGSYDVVMPDLRGHGASSRIAGRLSAELLVDDIAALIGALGLERPAVVGHSLGADVAGRLAAAHPLRALALADPALVNVAAGMALDVDNPAPWAAALFAGIRALRDLPHAERMQAGRQLLPPGAPPWAAADYVGFVEGMAQFDLAVYRHIAELRYLFEQPAVIAQIGCPTLLMTARPAWPSPSHAAGRRAFTEHLRAGQHSDFPDSGHFIMFDQHARFVEVLRAFLDERRAYSNALQGAAK